MKPDQFILYKLRTIHNALLLPFNVIYDLHDTLQTCNLHLFRPHSPVSSYDSLLRLKIHATIINTLLSP